MSIRSLIICWKNNQIQLFTMSRENLPYGASIKDALFKKDIEMEAGFTLE